MAITLENINIGNLANDGTGDPLRVAFTKINNNFSNLAGTGSSGPDGSIQYKTGNATIGTSSLVFDTPSNQLNINANIIPISGAIVNIGNANNYVSGLYLSGNALHVGNINLVESGNVITFPVTGSSTDRASLSGISNISVVNNISIGNNSSLCFSINTANSAVNQVLYTRDPTTFVSMTAKIISKDPVTLNSQSVTLSITKRQDNSLSDFSAHSTMFSGPPVTRYNVDINNGLLRVMVSPIFNEVLNHIVEITTYN